MEGTPAETAGLRQDDVIVGIDGSTIEGLSQEDVVSQLRGRPGSEVRLSIDREEAAAPLVLTVERSHIVPQTVSYHREGNLAYIRVSGFNNRTADSLRQKIDQDRSEFGSELRGYILDLRGTPGGLREQAVEESAIFVTTGRIVHTQGRHTDTPTPFPPEHTPPPNPTPHT